VEEVVDVRSICEFWRRRVSYKWGVGDKRVGGSVRIGEGGGFNEW
jgi:hypothetical protein